MIYYNSNNQFLINPLTSPGEEVTVFTSLYLSAGAPAPGEAKGLIKIKLLIEINYNLVQQLYSLPKTFFFLFFNRFNNFPV